MPDYMYFKSYYNMFRMISETYPIDNRGGDRNNLHVKDQGMSQPPHNTYTHTPGMPHTPGM